MNTILPDERQSAILARLAASGRVVAAELAEDFGTSEDTIRRDLRELAASGRCRRVYGGALPIAGRPGVFNDRKLHNHARKRALGIAAAGLLQRRNAVVIIDAGSTNRHVAEHLPADLRPTVITNAPAIAACLAERDGIDLVVIGGRVDTRLGGAVGAGALAELGRIRADLCFLGACAADPVAGLSAFDAEEAVFKRALVARSERTVVALTSDKFSTVAPFEIAPLADIADLVIEAEADGRAYEGAGPTLHRAQELRR